MSNQSKGVAVGSPAPDFTLRDGDGDEWRLSDRRGHVVVLLFYPGDETPVCTRQMCSVRDRWEDYAATGAEVVGISTDTIESHRKFSEHHELPLRLLADAGGLVAKLFGATSWLPNRAARAVVVIDGDGLVRFHKVQKLSLFRPKDDEVLAAIAAAGGDGGAKP
ncbi:MAG TPA: peroxiredoxin [Pyrinomonadaceae bacterium]|jgi:peroxiredoxin Q/BCP|nr:peroxiredoxin [Pyrinomonadaceae bacterium]